MKRLSVSKKWFMTFAVFAVAVSVAGIVFAEPNSEAGPGRYMMDRDDHSDEMMGSGSFGGMMGGYYGFPEGDRIGFDKVEESLDVFISYNRLNGIEIGEVMNFEGNYYAQLIESDSGTGALEVLIDPYSGYVSVEPGPNMMWNTKYGHMRASTSDSASSMNITSEEAVKNAQRFLDANDSGFDADPHAVEFYGYYTLHVLENDETVGMLSVNGYDGSVWYHIWHGDYIESGDGDHG